MKRLLTLGLFIICMTSLSACVSLPASGPSTGDVLSGAGPQSADSDELTRYALVDLDTAVLGLIADKRVGSFAEEFGVEQSPLQGAVRVGDIVSVVIWEAASSVQEGSGLTQPSLLPDQIVGRDGSIFLPYVGRVRIAGRSVEDAQAQLLRRMSKTTVQPQVLITVKQSAMNMVTVSGDNINGARLPLSGGGTRILDMIALSGGVRSPDYAANVQLIRDGRSATIPLQVIMNELDENIFLHPGDILIVSKNPEYFTAVGATGKKAQIPMDSADVSLAQALGKSGGLLDQQADPRGVFVFRYQDRATAAKLCGGCAFPDNWVKVPVVYRLDLDQAESFFIAQSFEMASNDVMYVSNASQVQFSKVVSLIRELLSPLTSAFVLERAATR